MTLEFFKDIFKFMKMYLESTKKLADKKINTGIYTLLCSKNKITMQKIFNIYS